MIADFVRLIKEPVLKIIDKKNISMMRNHHPEKSNTKNIV